MRDAKRDAKIPYSQEPYDITYEPMTQAESFGGHVILDENTHQPINTRLYWYKNIDGDVIVIQDHSAGHKVNGQGAHFNVRPPEDLRNGVVNGCKTHYEFRK